MSASIPQLGQAGRTCVTCRYWDAARGWCRFNSPTVVGWPAAAPEDWCGEWGPPRTEMQPSEDGRVIAALRDEVRAERLRERVRG